MSKNYLLFGMLVVFGACAHKPVAGVSPPENRLSVESFKKAKLSEPVLLRLKANLGQIEKTRFNSASKTEVFEKGSLTNTLEESIEFLAKAEITKILKTDEFVEMLTTSKKDGLISLHDFAMPEIGEELLVSFNSQGKILKAGNYSSNSLYFVPPISLPADTVNIGDTWTMNAHWVTEQGVPLSLRLLSILKGFIECGEKDKCADIELSGDVTIDSNMAGVNFQSVWRGRIFFAIEKGSLVWQLIESHEAWNTEKLHREVRSCLESELIEPAKWGIWKDQPHKCQIPTLESAAQD